MIRQDSVIVERFARQARTVLGKRIEDESREWIIGCVDSVYEKRNGLGSLFGEEEAGGS